jgi:flagellar basal-body rod protein FlgC
MGIPSIGAPVDVAVAGLKVQATRLNVIATNIANSNSTRTASGEPYRRQDVVVRSTGGPVGGRITANVVQDTRSEFQTVLSPGHPDADANGYVRMPNVQLPVEMMHMVTATRAYQANAAVLKRYQDLMDVTLELLR